jgi:hypothetical protein
VTASEKTAIVDQANRVVEFHDNISQGTAGVSVELKAKSGENIDVEDIKRCLDHTANQLER